jgi:hypothetical protein
MSGKRNGDYEIGYGKPPVATRFQKGTSGNPSGRPKKVAIPDDPGEILQSIENEQITVTDNGRRKRMTKAEIHIRQLFTRAIRGDLRAVDLIVSMAKVYFAPQARAADGYEVMGETEAARRFGRGWRKRVEEWNAKLGFGK